ncbi:MAG: Trm112 family protein [Deltaproteobacteria bacterium]|nr:Trm112 family protein [Deltaproteobacteria bacterium]
MTIVSNELLEVLACPACKGTLVAHERKGGLVCLSCRLLFPVREGVPIMLIDEASRLDDEGECI